MKFTAVILSLLMALSPVIVGPTGNYKSFTEAVFKTKTTDRPIIV